MSEIETALKIQLDFGPDGLGIVPVVTQDYQSLQVLILSYVNRQALEETQKTGYAVYWSRSRQVLWPKGASSGNQLEVKEIRINCEQNSLLFLVRQTGDGACHALRADKKAHTSCYYRRLGPNGSLKIIDE